MDTGLRTGSSGLSGGAGGGRRGARGRQIDITGMSRNVIITIYKLYKAVYINLLPALLASLLHLP
jgi:hypothetical protein